MEVYSYKYATRRSQRKFNNYSCYTNQFIMLPCLLIRWNRGFNCLAHCLVQSRLIRNLTTITKTTIHVTHSRRIELSSPKL